AKLTLASSMATFADNVTVNGGYVYLGTGGFYAQNEYKTTGSVAAAGWYKVAHIDGSAGRGQQQVTVYTAGGSYAPQSTTIRWWHDWGSTAGISVISEYPASYWTDVRVTDDGTNSFLEVYFTQAISVYLGLQYIGGHDAGTLYSGTLSAGSGTVRSQTKLNGYFALNDKFYVNSSGNVGIGTASPGASLDIGGNPNNAIRTSYLNISANNAAVTDRPYIRGTTSHLVINGGGTTSGGDLYLNYTGDGATGSVRIRENLFVMNTGNVGIGTAGPGAKLEVQGTLETNDRLTITDVQDAGGNILFSAANPYIKATSYIIMPGGLYVLGGTLYALNTAYLRNGIRDDNGGDTFFEGKQSISFNIDYDNNDADTRYFSWRKNGAGFGAGSELMRLTESGNVGIGTASPGAKLEVSDSGSPTIRIKPLSGTNNLVSNYDFWGTFYNYPADTGVRRVANIQAGFATDVWETEYMAFGLGSNDAAVLPTERMRITGNGYVGIGTMNPGAQLDLSTDSARKLTTTTWATGSDARIKTSVESINNALEIISQVRPVKFHYTSEFLSAHPSVVNTDYYNFIAQEYQQVFPNSVTETDGLLYLNSSNMIPYAIAGIKEQQLQITPLVNNLYIASSGNIGIGYVNPGTAKLAINGNVGIGTISPGVKLEVYGGHGDTKARLYSTGNGATLDASLDMWASEPGWTYDGSGIGNNVNGSPYYGRRNLNLGQSYIRFYGGHMYLATGSGDAGNSMFIQNNGNVGIGTTEPETKFHTYASGPLSPSADADYTMAKFYTNNTTLGNLTIGGHTTYGVYIDTRQAEGQIGGAETTSIALYARADLGAANTEWAGYFQGNVRITGSHPDLAEIFPITPPVEEGDIVVNDPQKPTYVKKSNKASDSSIIGIYSTTPSQVIEGKITENIPDNQKAPIALAGRVTTKVSTINGPIKSGDLITSSKIPGVGMKATKAGPIVGKALESYNNSDPNVVGKIIVFVNVSWYDPDVYLTSTGELQIQGQESSYTLKNTTTDTLITRIGAFSEAVIANFQAGIAVIQDLTVNTLTVKQKLISPVAYIEDLEVKNLVAETITAPQISQIEKDLLDLATKYSTASAILADLQRPAAEIEPVSDLQSPVPLDSLILTDLQVNNSLIANILNSKDQDTLFLQPLANAPINLLAGLMTLTPNGQVIINGDLAVTGKVLASKIEALESNLENLTAQTATISSLTITSLTVQAEPPSSTASSKTPLDASAIQPGAQTLLGVNEVNYPTGAATLPAGETEITISNTNVTQDTYIYLTPTSSTSNQTLFVKSKTAGLQTPLDGSEASYPTGGQFTIAIPEAINSNIQFNYWLIQTM
ncbi:tail fiber domain-containing protein, partial [Patescibacteria group bacterium]|nr:tail fiber domain-containing protein [Patescibacteria group bacterium]